MKLQIIQTPDYILGMDTNIVNTNDYYWRISSMGNYPERVKSIFPEEKQLIIAHTPLNGKEPLEGVWLLPEIENWEELYQKNGIALQDERNKLLFRKGYKAAGGYTEEDMVKLIEVCKEAAMIGTSVFVERKGKEFLKSLKPFPIEFEVEMEWVNNGDDSHDEGGTLIGSIESYQQPKILNNIIQGKYIYK